MKWILLIPTLLISSFLWAQPGYTLAEELHSYNGSLTFNHYKLYIQKAMKKDVLKGLEKRLESGTRKVATVDNSKITIEKVVYKDYWSDSLVIDAEIVEAEKGTMCFFLIKLDTNVIGSKTHAELDVKIRRYLKKFGLNMYADALDDEMNKEKKLLRSIEKEHKSALREIDKSDDKVKANTVEIELKKDEIDINKADRHTKVTEMEVQKMVIVNSSDENPEQQKLEKTKLKTMKSEFKKLKTDYKKLNSQISKMDSSSRDEELKKEKLVIQAKNIKDRVTAQAKVIEAVKAKQDEAEVALNVLK